MSAHTLAWMSPIMGLTMKMTGMLDKKKDLSMTTLNPTADQTVAGKPNMTDRANNLGRAALISTSPSGVLGTDPTGRRKLLGND